MWDDTLVMFDESGDCSPRTRKVQRVMSDSTGGKTSLDNPYNSAHPQTSGEVLLKESMRHDHNSQVNWLEQQPNECNQDHRTEHIIEAISSSDGHREAQHRSGSQRRDSNVSSNAHTYFSNTVATNRPSLTAATRTSSYMDFNSGSPKVPNDSSPDISLINNSIKEKKAAKKPRSASSGKENCPLSQLRLPTPYGRINHDFKPNPLAQRQPTFSSEMSRHTLSVLPSFDRFNCGGHTQISQATMAHTPSMMGSIKGRKEGKAMASPTVTDKDIRHDQSLLPNLGNDMTSKEQSFHTRIPSTHTLAAIEIIDVDAIDPTLPAPTFTLNQDTTTNATPHEPQNLTHKLGMSSIDSTDRLEQQLFSALGDELGSFDMLINATRLGSGPAEAPGGGTDLSMQKSAPKDFEPPSKRKRADMLGEESLVTMRNNEPEGEDERAETVLESHGT